MLRKCYGTHQTEGGLFFQAYLVFRSHGRPGSSDSVQSGNVASKFLGGKRSCGGGGPGAGARSVCSSVPVGVGAQYPQQLQPYGSALHNVMPIEVQEEFQRLYAQLEALRERNLRLGNRHLADKIYAMQEAGRKGSAGAAAPRGGTPPPAAGAVCGGVVENIAEAPRTVEVAADASPEPREQEPWRLAGDRQASDQAERRSGVWTPIY
ncbi:putative G-protein coupled receptor 158, partial [Frankliniella fusca]